MKDLMITVVKLLIRDTKNWQTENARYAKEVCQDLGLIYWLRKNYPEVLKLAK